jgi:hypothetical protein
MSITPPTWLEAVLADYNPDAGSQARREGEAMRLDVVPESLVERLALRAGLVPRPFLQTILAAGMARALHVGVKLGVFETLNDAPMTTEEVAARVGTHPYPTGKLLNTLAGMGYLGLEGGERYSLTKDARKWLVGRSLTSLRDYILEQEFIAPARRWTST